MYQYFETRTSGSYSYLSAHELQELRDQKGQSLIYRIFYLDGFFADSLSNALLQAIEQDFETLRLAGVKAIVRFAYTDVLPYDENDQPVSPYNDTPPLELLYQHIHQLGPILANNSDVILTVHQGFFGTWGENYYSDLFGSLAQGAITPQQQARRNAVTDSLLKWLPLDQTVSLRYPLLKSAYLGLTIPDDSLTKSEAFSGSPKSRLAWHNDCFLADFNDYTFLDTLVEKPYWRTESRYLLMGGESCRDNEVYTNCNNALRELGRFHWTYLNDYYRPEVLQRWKDEGCFEIVRKQLGYRLALQEANLPDTMLIGASFSVQLTFENLGWAALVKYRPVELVLRESVSGMSYFLPVSGMDLRYCEGGSLCNYALQISMPDTLPIGVYHLLLRFPDVHPNLQSDPRFSIRLANDGIWEATTGLNDLGHTVHLAKENCPQNLEVVLNTSSSGTSYQAADSLIASGILATGTQVDFKAGKVIRWLPGFYAPKGSQVTAQITSCSQLAEPFHKLETPFPESEITTLKRIRIWPNPVREKLFIACSSESDDLHDSLEINLLNIQGRVLQTLLLPPGQLATLDLLPFPPGMYLLSWTTADGVEVHKILKQ